MSAFSHFTRLGLLALLLRSAAPALAQVPLQPYPPRGRRHHPQVREPGRRALIGPQKAVLKKQSI